MKTTMLRGCLTAICVMVIVGIVVSRLTQTRDKSAIGSTLGYSPRAIAPYAAISGTTNISPHEQRLKELHDELDFRAFMVHGEMERIQKLRREGDDAQADYELQAIQKDLQRLRDTQSKISEEEKRQSDEASSQATASGSEPSLPAATKRRLSEDDLKHLRENRQYDSGLIAAVDAILAAPSSNDAATIYCRFTIQQMDSLFGTGQAAKNDAGHQWYDEQRLGVCRGRVLTGLDHMPSPDKFREYAEEARRDLAETDQTLAANASTVEPPPAPVVKAASPTSGVLCNGAVNVAQNGELVFRNLPSDRLKFAFDRDAWQPTIHRQPDGTQTLTMRSLKSGIQTVCDMRWEIVQ